MSSHSLIMLKASWNNLINDIVDCYNTGKPIGYFLPLTAYLMPSFILESTFHGFSPPTSLHFNVQSLIIWKASSSESPFEFIKYGDIIHKMANFLWSFIGVWSSLSIHTSVSLLLLSLPAKNWFSFFFLYFWFFFCICNSLTLWSMRYRHSHTHIW